MHPFSSSCQVTSAKFSRVRDVVGVTLALPSGSTETLSMRRAFVTDRTCRSNSADSMVAMEQKCRSPPSRNGFFRNKGATSCSDSVRAKRLSTQGWYCRSPGSHAWLDPGHWSPGGRLHRFGSPPGWTVCSVRRSGRTCAVDSCAPRHRVWTARSQRAVLHLGCRGSAHRQPAFGMLPLQIRPGDIIRCGCEASQRRPAFPCPQHVG